MRLAANPHYESCGGAARCELASFMHFKTQVSYRDTCKMTSHFKSYVANLNRIRMSELIERLSAERNAPAFKASIVVNPHTGVPYDVTQDEA